MKIISATLGMTLVLVLSLLGGFAWLWYTAFGQAKCSGVNVPAAIGVTVIGVLAIIFAVQGIDLLSDMAAASNSRKAATDTTKQLQDSFRAQQAQFSALNSLIAAQKRAQPPDQQGQSGGLGYDDGIFNLPQPGGEQGWE